jgi:ubiquinone/menaquinone biosynthesis C-methylase UbiE
MATLTTKSDWTTWLTRWHRQQEHYLHDRPRRFAIMLDYVQDLRGSGPLALMDLCCGPGSITSMALSRFDSTVTAVDIDPWLVEMGRRTLGDDPRVCWLEADVRADGWAQSLPSAGYDAVLSSTALHWLHRDELVQVFGELARLVAPGGVFLNADHLPVGHGRIATIAHDRKQAESSRKLAAPGAESWEQYWEAARAEPAFVALLAERERRFANRRRAAPVPVEFHREALLAAGFTEVGEIWRDHDDAVLLAIR